MPSRCCEFVDSRLRRSPPDRASAVPYGQGGENAMRFPHLAHRSAAAHKLHSTPQQHRMILISGNVQTSSRLPAFSLCLPGSCPNNRDRRREIEQTILRRLAIFPDGFTLDAAASGAADDAHSASEIIGDVAELVTNSLVACGCSRPRAPMRCKSLSRAASVTFSRSATRTWPWPMRPRSTTSVRPQPKGEGPI
jgi:hypothetical protein